MPNLRPNFATEVVNADFNTAIMTICRIRRSSKLVTPFKGERREVFAFIANIDTAFEAIKPRSATTMYKSTDVSDELAFHLLSGWLLARLIILL
jgi:hypothetical protein